MKKILLLLIIIFLTGCSNNKNYISKILDINLDNCTITDEVDTHEGFLGDGELYVKLKCKDLNISNWHNLPFVNPINEILNMEWCYKDGCHNFYERYKINNLDEGYYYFIDRHSDTKDKYDASEINNRSSYNFTLAIYDTLNKILYYYELDT